MGNYSKDPVENLRYEHYSRFVVGEEDYKDIEDLRDMIVNGPDWVWESAVNALAGLGSNAKEAVPDLLAFISDEAWQKDYVCYNYAAIAAIHAVADISPESPAVIFTLGKFAAGSLVQFETTARMELYYNLGRMRPRDYWSKSLTKIPSHKTVFGRLLLRLDKRYRHYWRFAQGEDNYLDVQDLEDMLKRKYGFWFEPIYEWVWLEAIFELRTLGSKAKSAVPTLLEFMQNERVIREDGGREAIEYAVEAAIEIAPDCPQVISAVEKLGVEGRRRGIYISTRQLEKLNRSR